MEIDPIFFNKIVINLSEGFCLRRFFLMISIKNLVISINRLFLQPIKNQKKKYRENST